MKKEDILIILSMLALAISFCFLIVHTEQIEKKIEAQKVFKLGDATYQCKQIQKLEFEK